jgi:hypothetical protein
VVDRRNNAIRIPQARQGCDSAVLSVHYSNIHARPGVHGGAGSWKGDPAPRGGPPAAVAEARRSGPFRDDVTPFDTIKQTVLRMKGKIFVIQTPADLSNAIAEIGRGK